MSSESRPRGLVLVVEDEPAIAEVIRLNLVRAGYGVQVERRGDDALAAVGRHRPAAVVLDVGLPGIDGVEVCRRMRAGGDWTPVLFVTARDDEVDRIVALELGADDYITKPFSPRELVARVTSVLRRTHGAPEAAPQTVGAVTLDLVQRRVYVDGGVDGTVDGGVDGTVDGGVDGEQVHLTVTEFDLLAYLLRRPGRVFSREQLLSEVWGYASAAGTRTVDVHIAQLRAKLGDASPIRTVRGVGYSAESPA